MAKTSGSIETEQVAEIGENPRLGRGRRRKAPHRRKRLANGGGN